MLPTDIRYLAGTLSGRRAWLKKQAIDVQRAFDLLRAAEPQEYIELFGPEWGPCIRADVVGVEGESRNMHSHILSWEVEAAARWDESLPTDEDERPTPDEDQHPSRIGR